MLIEVHMLWPWNACSGEMFDNQSQGQLSFSSVRLDQVVYIHFINKRHQTKYYTNYLTIATAIVSYCCLMSAKAMKVWVFEKV